MSDDEDQTQFFGTALPELPKDVIPTKKPITVADQIAVDTNGRRRFHGAFTGGFSAGYWNTVGSQEGWKPQSFKSSRQEKAELKTQNAKDFMDEEDVGEFGINPQRIQTTNDFSTSAAKDKHANDSIDGNPVLSLFLIPPKDRTCVALLKKMGWRGGKYSGFAHKKRQKTSAAKVYNCSLGPMEFQRAQSNEPEVDEDSNDSGSSVVSIKFDLDDFEILTHTPKVNRFGLGYVGLTSDRDKGSFGQHINLFAPFEVADRKANKKLSITGQAFGVGAFEDDDDDIYAMDDMTKYNFETTKKQEQIVAPKKDYHNTIEGFKPGVTKSKSKTTFTINLTVGYKPRNWLERKSRFGPVVNERVLEELTNESRQGTGRHMLTPDERGAALNVEQQKPKRVNPFGAPKKDNPILQKIKQTPQVVANTVEERLKQMSAAFDSRFVSEKTQSVPHKIEEGLKTMSETFESRFVSEKPSILVEVPVPPAEKKSDIAVLMKREIIPWFPCVLLCQKMNIADPTKCKDNTSKLEPFSLLAHVNPLAGTKHREKEFAKSTKNEDEVIPNAYVPPKPKDTPVTQINTVSFPIPLPSSEPVATTSKPIKQPPLKPKTELEINIQKLEKSHPSEKKDIYKAIFESSDEEDEDHIDTADNSTPGVTFVPPRLAEDVNILRNTSPPRGIFSGLTSSRVKFPLPDPVAANVEMSAAPDLYGPLLPSVPISIEQRLMFVPSKRRRRSSSSDSSQSDEWIAKGDEIVQSSNKKHKKVKSKHKKSKSSKSVKKSKKGKKSKKSDR